MKAGLLVRSAGVETAAFAPAQQELDKCEANQDEEPDGKVEHFAELQPDHQVHVNGYKNCLAQEYTRIGRRLAGEAYINEIRGRKHQPADRQGEQKEHQPARPQGGHGDIEKDHQPDRPNREENDTGNKHCTEGRTFFYFHVSALP